MDIGELNVMEHQKMLQVISLINKTTSLSFSALSLLEWSRRLLSISLHPSAVLYLTSANWTNDFSTKLNIHEPFLPGSNCLAEFLYHMPLTESQTNLTEECNPTPCMVMVQCHFYCRAIPLDCITLHRCSAIVITSHLLEHQFGPCTDGK